MICIEEEVEGGKTPEWRTTAVVELCQAMRESAEYSALPILADELEEAGCTDTNVLNAFREPLPDWSSGRDRAGILRYLALIYSRETADAVAVIDKIAEIPNRIGTEPDSLAYEWDEDNIPIATGEPVEVDGVEMISRSFDFIENDRYWNEGPLWEGLNLPWGKYWEAFKVVTGVEPTDEFKDYGFFTCSC